MSNIGKALLWAAGIIAAAVFMQAQGMSDGASFGVIAGLSGAAWASLNAETGCGRSCLQ
ncbi:hypothetical protein MACH24_05650 [Erythrobacter sp. Dej080120_24]|uniref:hypothetical protein n=1 Tax=Erythrobacter TaxID=1041 RepID=UPI00207ACE7E|nr:hypothetical protein [Erythrobacter aurantius]BDW81127.1 hypothetical protein MACH24_05650 [Erythrobacter sp. Dej080120_24]